MAEDAYRWWKRCLAGKRDELTPGHPEVGFYRDKQRAIEIYRSEDGKLHCNTSSGYQPRHDDEIDSLFGFASMNPITYETYLRFIETGQWPESISDDLDRARIGHNSGALHEQVQDEIDTVIRAFNGWIKEIGGEIQTEEQDKKGEEFKTRIMGLAKQAADSRVLLKKPFLEGGRLVDKTWMPIEEQAENGKSLISGVLTPYRVARQKIRDEEAALLAELIEASPAIETAYRRAKPKTGLRTTKVAVVDDIQKAAAQLAAMKEPPEDFVEAVRSVAKRLIDAGISVSGVHIEERKKA